MRILYLKQTLPIKKKLKQKKFLKNFQLYKNRCSLITNTYLFLFYTQS